MCPVKDWDTVQASHACMRLYAATLCNHKTTGATQATSTPRRGASTNPGRVPLTKSKSVMGRRGICWWQVQHLSWTRPGRACSLGVGRFQLQQGTGAQGSGTGASRTCP